ncbi:transposase [Pseudomonas xanthosomatis]|nr:transposase [Pseudomonas xanthosomatis]
MLNCMVWVLCSGATSRDMLERYGPRPTIYQRFRDCRNQHALNQIL